MLLFILYISSYIFIHVFIQMFIYSDMETARRSNKHVIYVKKKRKKEFFRQRRLVLLLTLENILAGKKKTTSICVKQQDISCLSVKGSKDPASALVMCLGEQMRDNGVRAAR